MLEVWLGPLTQDLSLLREPQEGAEEPLLGNMRGLAYSLSASGAEKYLYVASRGRSSRDYRRGLGRGQPRGGTWNSFRLPAEHSGVAHDRHGSRGERPSELFRGVREQQLRLLGRGG